MYTTQKNRKENPHFFLVDDLFVVLLPGFLDVFAFDFVFAFTFVFVFDFVLAFVFVFALVSDVNIDAPVSFIVFEAVFVPCCFVTFFACFLGGTQFGKARRNCFFEILLARPHLGQCTL